ncbi:hypothetical protein [Sphingomonas sp. 3-13AW]|uniref:hypothetical protein n=1 Tax=Sphingomonas sp. 3-13AW TaxID=3050450 RepID=UPI003BB5BA27
MTRLPEPFHLTLDAFLKGPSNEDADLDVDRVFAKRLPAVLFDIAEDDPEALQLSDRQLASGSASLCRPGFRFVGIFSGVLLIDDRNRIVGAYAGADLTLKPALQGFGLGRELVTERALRDGSLPVWNLDTPAYTPAGLAAHQSAWRRAQDDPQEIVDRLARLS